MNERTLLLLILCLLAVPFSLSAQDDKPKIKVGGQLYIATYYDTYDSVDNRDGVTYSFPKAPRIEDVRGYDMNEAGQFAMSPYQTRLHVEATGFQLLDAEARMYIETDFMGTGGDYYQMVRLRHAYLDFQWDRNELLLGQTNNLLMVDETVSGALTSGSGSPISVLERPVIIRYGHRFGNYFKIYVAASYHHVKTGDPDNSETWHATRNNGFPSGELRMQIGNPDRFLFGVAGGYKSLLPRLETETGKKTNTRIGSYSTTAFLRLKSRGGASLKLQGVYGTDLSHLGMVGGYGKLYYGENEKDHFEYTNFITVSGWIDLETKSYNGFRYGLFGGYMQNLGTEKEVDHDALYAWHPGLNLTGRISPRATYTQRNFMLGLEYSYYFARWGETFNRHYLPVSSYDVTMNHRILLLARYSF